LEKIFLTDELKMMRDTIRRFVQGQVIPVEQKIGPFATEVPEEFILPLQQKARQMGFWQMGALPEWGGAGLDIFSQTVLMEEASRHRFGLVRPALNAFGEEIPSLLARVNSAFLERTIRPVMESGAGFFKAIGNPSDFIARRDGNGGWSISGVQRFVANVDRGGVGLLWAQLHGSAGTGLFILENNENIKCRPNVVMRTLHRFDISLQDYKAPEGSFLGEGGRRVAEVLPELQLLLAARCLGIAQEALRLASEYATQRETFGKLLEKREAIQDMVVDSWVALSGARLLTWCMAKKLSLGDASEEEVAMAKLSATETAFRVVDQSIQVHGGMGIAQEMPLERWYRELRLARLELVPSESIRQKLALAQFQKYRPSKTKT
jgi:acyl-CoA dehydrogenase